MAVGRASLVGWTLLLVNVLSIVLGTAILQRVLERRGLPGWAALAYGLWGGLGVALLHGTAEPVAYLCVLAGLEARTAAGRFSPGRRISEACLGERRRVRWPCRTC